MKGMNAFELYNPRNLAQASELLGNDPAKAQLIAGGIDLLTELQARIIEPSRLVNLKSVPGLNRIQLDNRGLALGPLVTLSAIADNHEIARDYAALAQAAESVGSPQIRHIGTIGGNLCQRPRCWYYRDEAIKCLKKGGARCYAADQESANKYNAILGGGPSYIVHPSDCATALVALGATITYGTGRGRSQALAAEQFFVLPSERLQYENVLKPDEIIESIFVPRPRPGTRSVYLKFRERDSMDWAVSAVAVVATMNGDRIQDARVVLGGVAPKPWRSPEAEAALKGKAFSRELANAAAAAALADAAPLARNGYKVPLTRVLVRRAIEIVATGKSPVMPAV
jgi:xanthine dehydrogenase YagS FAD-binding subunit